MLSIIVPAFNEEHLVGDLLGRLGEMRRRHQLACEIIVVDDGSRDATVAKVEEFIRLNGSEPVRLIRHAGNQGKGAAVRTGMGESCGDIVIIQDADLEYDPEDIVRVIEPIRSGEALVVYGSRILREKELGRSGVCGLITGKHPHSYVLAYLGGVAITKFVNLLTGARLTDEPTCYKCFHRSALDGLTIDSGDFAWEPEITMKILRRGTRIHEVPIGYHPRKREEGKKINWKDGVKALWTVWKHR
jgi:dolichol-phosphate mannosyltransferase